MDPPRVTRSFTILRPMATVVLPIASAVGVTVTIVVVMFVLLATTWIPLKMRRERRQGEKLAHQDAERGDLAAEVEQMRRTQAGESPRRGKS
jgi:hypothetical protein